MGLMGNFGGWNDGFVFCQSGDMLRFSPMHHEKYVLAVLLDQPRRMEHTKIDNDGSAVIVGRNFVRRDVQICRES